MADKNVDLEPIWVQLKEGIDQVFESKSSLSKSRFMELYYLVHSYCATRVYKDYTRDNVLPTTKKKPLAKRGADLRGDELYSRLQDYLKTYIENLAQDIDLAGEDLLSFYCDQWEGFQRSSKVLNGICSYMNRHWVRKEFEEGRQANCEIHQLALITWRDNVFKRFNVPLTEAVAQMVECERSGEPIDEVLVGRVVKCFDDLGLNEDDPDYHEIKKCIGILIKKGYLKLNKEDQKDT